MTGVAQVAFHGQANGSLVRLEGKDVGSSLIGQEYTMDSGKKDDDGNAIMVADPSGSRPAPPPARTTRWPPAAPTSARTTPTCSKAVQERKRAVAALEGVAASQVPPDAVTSSGSGLDPHISPAYADLQVARVAQARGLGVATCRGWSTTTPRGAGPGVPGRAAGQRAEAEPGLAALG